MDEELRAFLNAMEARIMTRLNDSEERILNRLEALEGDFLNTKDFLLRDSLVANRRWLDHDMRITAIEKGGKGR